MITTDSAVLGGSPILAVDGSYPSFPLFGIHRDTVETFSTVLVFPAFASRRAARLRHSSALVVTTTCLPTMYTQETRCDLYCALRRLLRS